MIVSSEIGVVMGLDPNGDGFLSLRKKPKAKEISKLYNGDKVEILDKRGKYYKVKDFKSGKEGWSHKNWIKVNKEVSKPIKKLKGYYQVNLLEVKMVILRNMPRDDAKKIGELPYNARFIELEKCINNSLGEKWCKLGYPYNNMGSWIKKDLLQRYDEKSHREQKHEGKIFKVIRHKKGEFLNVRAGKGTKYHLINRLPYNQVNIEIQTCQDDW